MTTTDWMGQPQTIALSHGTMRYRDAGTGPTLVFVHGVLVNGTLWREVAPPLARRFRCVVPDLPLGAHAHPLGAGADRSPRGTARRLAEFLAALDLRDVILIGNDTGGAICQLTIAQGSERIAGLILTNCDAYEAFFPPLLRPFQWGARIFGARFGDLLARLLRYRPAQRALLALVAHRRLDPATLDAYFLPFTQDRAARGDLIAFLAAMSNRDTLAAAETFPRFRHPVLLAWGRDDFIFPARLARRLASDFPDATLAFIPRSRAFVPEDRPGRLAELIAAFLEARGYAPPPAIEDAAPAGGA